MPRLLSIHPSFAGLQEQKDIRDEEVKTTRGICIMYAMICITEGFGSAANVVPVGLGREALVDPAPAGWKEKMINTVNSGITF